MYNINDISSSYTSWTHFLPDLIDRNSTSLETISELLQFLASIDFSSYFEQQYFRRCGEADSQGHSSP